MSGYKTRSATRNALSVKVEQPLASKENTDNDKYDEVPKKRKRDASKRKKANSVENDIVVKREKLLVKDCENPVVTKTLKFKGLVPVDEECTLCVKDYHVYVCGENIYNAMLNQTNVGQNNNKYYFLQLLKHNDRSQYCVWFRWGRVGKIAGTNLQKLPLESAIQAFEKKFKDKTNNLWEMRNSFTKFHHKYDLLQMDYGKKDEKESRKSTKSVSQIKSNLDLRVQKVMDLLFDIKEFEESVKEMKFDIKKAPLGKLTENQIKAGYSSLKKIETCMQNGDFGRKMVEACSEFYTRIPHDFGMKRPPVMRSPTEMKEKLQLLEALADIQVAITIMDNSESGDKKENPIDVRYKSLQCEFKPLQQSDDNYKIIEKYVKNTHAPTHRSYELNIEDVFELSKPEQDKLFKKGVKNRMLLWHGSRLTNWCGILQQGLRVAPPEAPSTGYMFGKGIYFADMVSKSANYCFATKRQPIGFLLLCEVALGSMNEKYNADYTADVLPDGKDSTKGIGKTEPNPLELVTMKDGTLVPIGMPVSVDSAKSSALLYNEYVVYNVNQVQARYLVKVKFSFTKEW